MMITAEIPITKHSVDRLDHIELFVQRNVAADGSPYIITSGDDVIKDFHYVEGD